MGILKWIFGIVVGIVFFYILVLIVNSKIQENEKRQFPCQYIKGMCTKKVNWKNCSGGLPENECERKLNRKG